MIDMNFLKPVGTTDEFLAGAGLEFLNRVKNSTFFKDLSFIIAKYINREGAIIEGAKVEIDKCIWEHTGIQVKTTLLDEGNMFTDAGFISPGNLLNNPNIEDFLTSKCSTIGEAYDVLVSKVIRGTIDPENGRVSGDYSEVKFKLGINYNISEFIDLDVVAKFKASIEDIVAAIILHEVGHMFFGLYFINRDTIDYLIQTYSIEMIQKAPTEKEKVAIFNDTSNLLDMEGVKVKELESLDADEVVIAFQKGLMNRNYRRTLSLGMSEMTTENLADAFSIKMGAGHSLAIGLRSLYVKTNRKLLSDLWVCLRFRLLSLLIPIIGIYFYVRFLFSTFFLILQSLFVFKNKMVSGTYNTDYRRIKEILNQEIADFSKSEFDQKEKVKVIKTIKDIEKIAEEQKSFYEGTAVQRTIGWICSGSDFKKREFENYSNDLLNHKLTIYTSIGE